eukprot:EC792480.1.p2 GENE.EC792480.1~~EC792480.1.p2  ORF type:complete len:147 (+),score=43.77 EC792480.1:59-499(+)
MDSATSDLSPEEVDMYMSLTHNLTRRDIHYLAKKFYNIASSRRKQNPLGMDEPYIMFRDWQKNDMWANNRLISPLLKRIFRVFSGLPYDEVRDTRVYLTLDGFIDMADSLHADATFDPKAELLSRVLDRPKGADDNGARFHRAAGH